MIQKTNHQKALGVSITVAAVSLGFAVTAAVLVVASLIPVSTFILTMSISLPVAYLSICQASESFKFTKNSSMLTDFFSTVKTIFGVEDKLFIEKFFCDLWKNLCESYESLNEYCEFTAECYTEEESNVHKNNHPTKHDTKGKYSG
ncbi:hypothetical protein [Wolbachia endosymbiont of Chironomus riparius]|uniref:hypothetical protein n=1 Tax=Wolbachia endosymbiont of Chironomus riparius TaxID=2883238 RepID=UPI0020A09B6A|nr:hypothetical protein [Wolbachia endosymbiont of Chironomus riparius]